MKCCTCAGFVVVARVGSHERHIEVHMRIDASRKNKFAGRIQHRRGIMRKILPDGDDLLPFDIHVGYLVFGGSDDPSVLDEDGMHG